MRANGRSRVRPSTIALTPARADETRPDYDRPSLVTITGTITETLEDSSTLGFRDRDTAIVYGLRMQMTF